MAKTALTGAAGEYFVAAELARRGWAASLTPRNADRTDVLAQHAETGRVAAIQVKCSSGANRFRLSFKDEAPTRHDNEYYALVQLREPLERPRFFILPRNCISALVFVDHRRWLATPGRDGQPHRDNPMRIVRIDDVWIYEDSWSLLDEPTSTLFRPPPWFVSCWRDHGLPDGHPGIEIPDEKLPAAAQPMD